MKKYFPILVSKAGELEALRNLDSKVKDEICPIIQVVPEPIPTPSKSKKPRIQKEPKEHRVLEKLSTAWSFEKNELFLDFMYLDPFDLSVAKSLIKELSERNVNVTPVVDANSNKEYLALISKLIGEDILQYICIRYSIKSLGLANLNRTLEQLYSLLGITPDKTTLLLDLGYIKDYDPLLAIGLQTFLTTVNNVSKFNGVVIASGSFPKDLTALTANKVHRLTRNEWKLWKDLIANESIASLISYSDFGSKHPGYEEVNFRGTCSIKYSVVDEFVIHRGEISGDTNIGNAQYVVFAKNLVSSPDYFGALFSWGDEKIEFYGHQELDDSKLKPGSSKNWVEISQNHHITLMHSIL